MKQSNILNVQPQSLEAEQAVLGSMLTNKLAVDIGLGVLSPEHFYKDAHSKIFSIMKSLSSANENIDTITVVNALKKNKELEGIGGAYYVTGLVEAVPTSANVKAYSEIVLDKAKLRQVILVSHELASKAYDDRESVSKILNYGEDALFKIAQNKSAFSNIKSFEDLLLTSIEKLELVHADKTKAMGVSYGLQHVDAQTLGLHPTELTYIAGRPGMGKTAFMLTVAQSAARSGHIPAIFSLEMSDQALADRVLYSESRVDSHSARGGFLNSTELQKVIETASKISTLPIIVIDCLDSYIQSIRSQARMLVRKENIGILMIDYMQLMFYDGKTDNRNQELSRISSILKSMAKEFNIPVMVLSQLNRSLEYRPKDSRRPILSDLRETGSMEQDADNVIALYRDWVYNPKGEDIDDFEESNKNKAEAIILKQRNGPAGAKVKLHWIPEYTRFENVSYRKEDENEDNVPF